MKNKIECIASKDLKHKLASLYTAASLMKSYCSFTNEPFRFTRVKSLITNYFSLPRTLIFLEIKTKNSMKCNPNVESI